MKFSEIIAQFSADPDVTVLCEDNQTEITDFAFWEPGDKANSTATLYFVHSDQIMRGSYPAQAVFSGCAADIPEEQKRPEREHSYAVVRPEAFARVFNRIHSIVEKSALSAFYVFLRDVLEETGSIEKLIDEASRVFGAALILCDLDFRILGVSRSIAVPDKEWAERVRIGYCDYDFICGEMRKKEVRETLHKMQAFVLSGPDDTCAKLCSRLFREDKQIGFFVLVEPGKEYNPEHIGMLEALSRKLSSSPKYFYGMQFKERDRRKQIFYELLIGADPAQLQEEIREFHIGEKSVALIYCIPDPKYEMPEENVIQRVLSETLKNGYVFTHEDAAVFLVEDMVARTEEDVKKILPDFQSQVCGISNSFENADRLAKAFQEARNAVALGRILNPREKYHFYGNYSIFYLLEAVRRQQSLEEFVEPALERLLLYDKKENSHLVETLRIHLMSGCNIKETSRLLYLHRNSVIYRLKKIREVMGMDLTKTMTRFRLMMSFAILDLENRVWRREGAERPALSYGSDPMTKESLSIWPNI